MYDLEDLVDSVVNEQAPRGYRNRGGAAGGGGRGGERGATTRTDFGPKRDAGYRGASAKPIDEGKDRQRNFSANLRLRCGCGHWR